MFFKIETFSKSDSDLIGPNLILKVHKDILCSTLRSAFKIETSDHSIADVVIANEIVKVYEVNPLQRKKIFCKDVDYTKYPHCVQPCTV